MQTETTATERAPIVAIMGHIDHGKSTLLSFIRKNNKPLNEAGGITQHISAYEVDHLAPDGKKHVITFVDTPGHEAFCGIRKRGAHVADVAVLVVSAEDGVKPQTLEALNSIIESKTPYIVAINKIDKPGASIEKTKQGLLENGIYVEGYGGDIACVALSAKTGDGVPELLDMIILVSELEGLTGNPSTPATGVVIESNRDVQKGISATCIIINGSVEKKMFVASGSAIAPIRIMENYLGKPIETATFSSPIKIIGWDTLPEVGSDFVCFMDREEARAYVISEKEKRGTSENNSINDVVSQNTIRVVVKADTGSSLEAVTSEIRKLATERVSAQIISSGIGTISENDIRLANGSQKAIIIGFNVKIDGPAKSLADRSEVEIETFDIIYKMNEWLADVLKTRMPKITVSESTGRAKILKLFSKVKDKQVIGGRVDSGSIMTDASVKIFRNDIEIGEGRIRELQQQKAKVDEVLAGKEFGSLISSNIEISSGDYIEAFTTVEK